jgi:hypothetical protein
MRSGGVPWKRAGSAGASPHQGDEVHGNQHGDRFAIPLLAKLWSAIGAGMALLTELWADRRPSAINMAVLRTWKIAGPNGIRTGSNGMS